MSDNNKDSAVCPNCPRHCPSDQLSCDRGRRYFGLEASGDEGHHGEGHRVTRSITGALDSLKATAGTHWSRIF